MRGLMVAALGAAVLVGFTAPGHAGDGVSWKTVDGLILPGTVAGASTAAVTTVRGIPAAGAPWSTLGGSASIDLASGDAEFEVRGLVLAATANIGTRGAANNFVIGEYICDNNNRLTTPQVKLSLQGDAKFEGNLGPAPLGCDNLAFLVTLPANSATNPPTPERWIAYGAVRKP